MSTRFKTPVDLSEYIVEYRLTIRTDATTTTEVCNRAEVSKDINTFIINSGKPLPDI